MTIKEYRTVLIGDKLYAKGNATHKGQCGTVIDTYPRKAMLLFDDGVYWYSYRVLCREPIVEKETKSVDNDEELIDITFTMNIVDNVDVTFGAVLGIVSHILYPRYLTNNYEAKIDQICDNAVSVSIRGVPKWVFDEIEKYRNWCDECAKREAEVKDDQC